MKEKEIDELTERLSVSTTLAKNDTEAKNNPFTITDKQIKILTELMKKQGDHLSKMNKNKKLTFCSFTADKQICEEINREIEQKQKVNDIKAYLNDYMYLLQFYEGKIMFNTPRNNCIKFFKENYHIDIMDLTLTESFEAIFGDFVK